MDSNRVLAQIRHTIETMRHGAVSRDDLAALSAQAVAQFTALDKHLSAGGTPPEEWREGPDAVGEEVHLRPCRECGALEGHNYPCDSVPEPLGGPVPGVAGSHLPESVL